MNGTRDPGVAKSSMRAVNRLLRSIAPKSPLKTIAGFRPNRRARRVRHARVSISVGGQVRFDPGIIGPILRLRRADDMIVRSIRAVVRTKPRPVAAVVGEAAVGRIGAAWR